MLHCFSGWLLEQSRHTNATPNQVVNRTCRTGDSIRIGYPEVKAMTEAGTLAASRPQMASTHPAWDASRKSSSIS